MTLENTPESGGANVSRVHIERGAVVMGTDGPLGTVEQIVMDENTGELRALIVRGGRIGADTEEVEIAASNVVPGTAAGHQVDLDIGLADIRAHPDLVRSYDPNRYVPVHEEVVLAASEASRAAAFSERPVVAEIRENAAEIV
ncbi:MAG TPA: PRC-barrel domain-containing protein, partial [Ktedonobacterales bacterium]|nr:PRC-barrel domain-containing protein [Ktedonobacterales bacterium]